MDALPPHIDDVQASEQGPLPPHIDDLHAAGGVSWMADAAADHAETRNGPDLWTARDAMPGMELEAG